MKGGAAALQGVAAAGVLQACNVSAPRVWLRNCILAKLLDEPGARTQHSSSTGQSETAACDCPRVCAQHPGAHSGLDQTAWLWPGGAHAACMVSLFALHCSC